MAADDDTSPDAARALELAVHLNNLLRAYAEAGPGGDDPLRLLLRLLEDLCRALGELAAEAGPPPPARGRARRRPPPARRGARRLAGPPPGRRRDPVPGRGGVPAAGRAPGGGRGGLARVRRGLAG